MRQMQSMIPGDDDPNFGGVDKPATYGGVPSSQAKPAPDVRMANETRGGAEVLPAGAGSPGAYSSVVPSSQATAGHSYGMNFGQALERLKRGERIARVGWNGKGMWLSLSGPLGGRKITSDKFWSQNNATYASRQTDGAAHVLPCITMKTADGSILMGWLASQTDMLAEDWVVVVQD